MAGKVNWRRVFQRYASPASILFGVLIGLLYTLLTYQGTILDARIALSVTFVSAGVMGVSYFASIARGRRTLPLLMEILKLIFVLWALIGLALGARIFTESPEEELTAVSFAIDFLVGAIGGTVWAFALMLAVGVRQNIASWEIVRFPVWVIEEAQGLWSAVTGRPLPERVEPVLPPTVDEKLDKAEDERLDIKRKLEQAIEDRKEEIALVAEKAEEVRLDIKRKLEESDAVRKEDVAGVAKVLEESDIKRKEDVAEVAKVFADRVGGMEDMLARVLKTLGGESLGAMVVETEDRFSEGETEKSEVRDRMDRDALRIKSDVGAASGAVEGRLNSQDAKLDLILQAIGRGGSE